MKDKEILKKAIEKAINNGWHQDVKKEIEEAFKYWDFVDLTSNDYYYSFIFSHDFAKAFWKDEEDVSMYHYSGDVDLKGWQYHLQEMVLEEEPLQYLKEFL